MAGMLNFTFVIPLNREDLKQKESADHYVVQNVLSIKELPAKLKDCIEGLHSDGCCYILDHFDTLYSVLVHAQQLELRQILKVLDIVVQGLNKMEQTVPVFLEEEMFPDLQTKMLNVLKMSVYILAELMLALERNSTKNNILQTKSKKVNVEDKWDDKKSAALFSLYNILQHPLQKLWEPPVVEEDFVNLAANVCYKALEVPSISGSAMKPMRETIFQIIGTLVTNYQHGWSSVGKIVQLLKLYEHLYVPLAEGVVMLVKEYGCRSLIREIIREMGEPEAMYDQAGPKAFAIFLSEVAKHASDLILPVMGMLEPYLSCDPHTMRNCVLEVIGEIVIQSLSGENMEKNLKETRDDLLDSLMDHLGDVNAFVRAKTLRVWQKLAKELAIPIKRWGVLVQEVLERLQDVSWMVVKNAIQLVLTFLEQNPFGALLNEKELRKKLEEEKASLQELEDKIRSPAYCAKLPRKERWEIFLPEIALAIEMALSKTTVPSAGSQETKAQEMDEATAPAVMNEIRKHIDEKQFEEAFKKLRLIENMLPGAAHTRKNNVLEWQVDYFVKLTRMLYVDFPDEEIGQTLSSEGENKENKGHKENDGTVGKRKKVLLDVRNSDTICNGTSENGVKDPLVKDKLTLEAKERRVHYLQESILFTEHISKAIELVAQLLHCKQAAVVQEAIAFLTAAKLFSFEGAEQRTREILLLVWSSEANIKTFVAESFQRMYLTTQSNTAGGRARAFQVVRNLCHLLANLDVNEQAALEILVKEWVDSGVIDSDCLKVMWERFSLTVPDTSREESNSALILLSMAATAKMQIVHTNLETLTTVGLGPRGEDDLELVLLTCRALMKLESASSASSNEEPLRFPCDYAVFKTLSNFIISKFSVAKEQHFLKMAEEAIDVIYLLAETPDLICTEILLSLSSIMKETHEDVNEEEKDPDTPDTGSNKNISLCSSELLKRYVFIIGHIGLRQWSHLDRTIYRELKRRNRLREEYLENKKQTGKTKTKSKKKNQDAGTSILSSSHASRLQFKKDATICEEDDVVGEAADDEDAEFINRVCETEILADDSLLGKLSSVVVTVCENPHKYPSVELKSVASIALTKLMLVSSQYCEKHLQLVFTMMEKSPEPIIRANLVFATGDLVNRFPNALDPWTKHLYVRLRDKSPKVRQATILVLKHLVMNEMVKVRGQISELALCVTDAEPQIADMASALFHELSKKGNTLYNVMPDIISRLSNPELELSEENFQTLMRFLMPLLSKDRQLEQLVEKICQRFRASNSDRQSADLAFCLTLMEYSERSLRRLLDGFAMYSDKLTIPGVYESLSAIISAAKKLHKPEKMVIVEELEAKIEKCLRKGLPGEDEENDNSGDLAVFKTPAPKRLAAKGTATGRKRGTGRRRPIRGRAKRRLNSSSESSSSDSDSD